MIRRAVLGLVLSVLAIWFARSFLGDGVRESVSLTGQTMGTHYKVIAIGSDLDRDELATKVQDRLAQVNGRLSSWDPESEVSRFSAMPETKPMVVSDSFVSVMTLAMQVHEQSGGRFDVTLGPLIELWGFGMNQQTDSVPSDDKIAAALQQVGQGRLLTVDEAAQSIAKRDGRVGINLSAIAKGFGVDQVGLVLRDAGIEEYLVEIGGDLLARGHNAYGQPWRIGIEKPDSGAQAIELVVSLRNHALATSGDYRNFFERNGNRFSHILDPISGRPVTHRTTSVTVVAEHAALADAWATALLVLGLKDGVDLANRLGLAALFIARDASGAQDTYITVQSESFSQLLIDE
ncbi:MAG: FAD:protein FMN transferase [Burkholderiaceae bacterium]